MQWYLFIKEVVIDRGDNPGLIKLDLFANGVFVTTISSDGLLISTSFGSCEYSAASGTKLHYLLFIIKY